MNKLIRCVVIMVMIMIPVNVMARMYPSTIPIPAVCFSDPRELYIYQEMILGETLVAAAQTLASATPENQGWVIIFYSEERDTWSFAGIVENEACVLLVGHGWRTMPLEVLPPRYEEYLERPTIPKPSEPKVSNEGALDGKL